MDNNKVKEEGYIQKDHQQHVKRYCQFLEISDNPELIMLYKECHSREKQWKEVREGIRAVGILEMELYIIGNKVCMIVDTPADFCWEEAMERLSHLPRQAEWEAFVAPMQGCDPEAPSAGKWQLMQRMFHLYDD